MYPLVSELAADGIPVTVSCRVLKLSRSAYYRWLDEPIVDSELDEAYPANAIHGAHVDDPEFGYRFLADEVRQAGYVVSDRVVWRICRDNAWWSVFGKPKRGKGSKPGAPSHDDLVLRNFCADAPNELWLSDITEHWTKEGKLYLCLFASRGHDLRALLRDGASDEQIASAVGHICRHAPIAIRNCAQQTRATPCPRRAQSALR